MSHTYQIRIKDTTGTLQAVLVDWRSLRYTLRLNAPSTHTLSIDGNDDAVQYFNLDAQIEVWRANHHHGMQWRLDYEGFHRTEDHQTTDRGRAIFTSYGRGYLDLLARRAVLYSAGSAGAGKNGPGETIMKAYVAENAGPVATAPPRLYDGVTVGLSIEADAAGGSTWQGSRAFRNLLEVCEEIAQATSVDFEVVGSGPATFEFRARAHPLGEDRSTHGLNGATGLNAAGNAPVIFSLDFGNMTMARYAVARTDEGNAVIMLGQGIQENRTTVQRTRDDAIAASPWNRREITRQANQESEVSGLETAGDALLEELQARETFTFGVLQSESTMYGRDYFLGDIITARYRSFERHLQIIQVDIDVAEGKEEITVQLRVLAAVPQVPGTTPGQPQAQTLAPLPVLVSLDPVSPAVTYGQVLAPAAVAIPIITTTPVQVGHTFTLGPALVPLVLPTPTVQVTTGDVFPGTFPMTFAGEGSPPPLETDISFPADWFSILLQEPQETGFPTSFPIVFGDES